MESFDSFIERLASSTPAPGGGAASASVAVIASGLNSMVSGITQGKKSYSKYAEDMAQINKRSRDMMEYLRTLMAEDEKAFNKIVEAWKLPKNDEKEKEMRNLKMRSATKEAIAVPWKIAAASLQILRDSLYLARFGLRSAITDSQCSAEFAIASIRGVLQNVAINLQNMDYRFRTDEEIKMKLFLEDAENVYSQVTASVREHMKEVSGNA